MLVVTKGYLINKQDYQDFDEIITLINEYGIKFTCYSLGSRKISSKNARNLSIGNYCEFEFFYSNSQDKLSKLKKVSTLSFLPEHQKMCYSLHMLNDYYYQIQNMEQQKWFDLYQKVIYFIIRDINDYLIILYLLVRIYKLNGLAINYSYCMQCNTTYHLEHLSLSNHTLLCVSCAGYKKPKYSTPTLALLKEIELNEELDLYEIDKYDLKELKALILDLIVFINDELGLYSKLFNELK